MSENNTSDDAFEWNEKNKQWDYKPKRDLFYMPHLVVESQKYRSEDFAKSRSKWGIQERMKYLDEKEAAEKNKNIHK